MGYEPRNRIIKLMAQGIEWEQEEVIEAIKPYLKLGYSVTKACKEIGLPQSTFATWLSNDKELRLKVHSWKNSVNNKARENVITKIKEGDEDLSKWWLERREKDDFSSRMESTGPDGESLPVAINIVKPE